VRSFQGYFFFDDVLREVDFFDEAFFVPVDLRAVDFVLFDDFVLFFEADFFVAVDLFAVDFLAVDFFELLFFAVDFFDDAFFAGTLPPAARASDRPIAIACLRLVTFLPLPPLFSVPAFRSCITFSTFSWAFGPYFAMRVSSLSCNGSCASSVRGRSHRALTNCYRDLECA
jgi:hypothetical protein